MDRVTHREIEALKAHVDSRFENTEKWLERLSAAVEKIAELGILDHRVGETERRLTDVEKKQAKNDKVVTIVCAVGTLALVVLPTVLSFLLGK